MSHFYPHLIAEIEPDQFFYFADDVRWTSGGDDVDDNAELSRYPKHKGGPFRNMEDAIESMTSRLGNPGYISALGHDEFLRMDEWLRKGIMENINPDQSHNSPYPS